MSDKVLTITDDSKVDLELKYSLLDSIYSNIYPVDKNAVYYELLSIGQRLIGSDDVTRIRRILKNSNITTI